MLMGPEGTGSQSFEAIRLCIERDIWAGPETELQEVRRESELSFDGLEHMVRKSSRQGLYRGHLSKA